MVPSVIYHQCSGGGNLRHNVVLLISLSLPSMSSEDTATYALVDLTYTLLNPTLTRPLPYLGDKHNAALNHLASIFNMSVPPQATTLVTTALQQEETPVPPLRVRGTTTTPINSE